MVANVRHHRSHSTFWRYRANYLTACVDGALPNHFERELCSNEREFNRSP